MLRMGEELPFSGHLWTAVVNEKKKSYFREIIVLGGSDYYVLREDFLPFFRDWIRGLHDLLK
jgi:hypothetical protein